MNLTLAMEPVLQQIELETAVWEMDYPISTPLVVRCALIVWVSCGIFLHLWLSLTQCNAVYGFFLDGTSQITTLAVFENVPFLSVPLCFGAVKGAPVGLRLFEMNASPITASELYIVVYSMPHELFYMFWSKS